MHVAWRVKVALLTVPPVCVFGSNLADERIACRRLLPADAERGASYININEVLTLLQFFEHMFLWRSNKKIECLAKSTENCVRD